MFNVHVRAPCQGWKLFPLFPIMALNDTKSHACGRFDDKH